LLIYEQAIAKCLKKVIELLVSLLHQNVAEYWVNLSFKKVINNYQLQVYLLMLF
jgi:hypothetical protein